MELTKEQTTDKIVFSAIMAEFENDDIITIAKIQRKCRCGYFAADRVLKDMIGRGLAVKDGKIYRVKF